MKYTYKPYESSFRAFIGEENNLMTTTTPTIQSLDESPSQFTPKTKRKRRKRSKNQKDNETLVHKTIERPSQENHIEEEEPQLPCPDSQSTPLVQKESIPISYKQSPSVAPLFSSPRSLEKLVPQEGILSKNAFIESLADIPIPPMIAGPLEFQSMMYAYYYFNYFQAKWYAVESQHKS